MAIPPPPPENQLFGNGGIPPPPPEHELFGQPSMLDTIKSAAGAGAGMGIQGATLPFNIPKEIIHGALTPDLKDASKLDPLADIARLGQKSIQGYDMASRPITETLLKHGVSPEVAAIPETIIGTLARANPMAPTNRLGAAGALAMGLPAIQKAATKLGQSFPDSTPGLSALRAKFPSIFGEGASGSTGNAIPGLSEGIQVPKVSELPPNKTSASLPDAPHNAGDVLPSGITITDKNYPVKAQELQDQITNYEARLQYLKDHNAPPSAFNFLNKSFERAKIDLPWYQERIPPPLPEGGPAALPKAVEDVAKVVPDQNRSKIAEGLMKAYYKMSKYDTQYALDHPEVISKAPSVEEANEALGKALGTKPAVDVIRERLGRTRLTESDWGNAIDRAERVLNGKEIDELGQKVPMTKEAATEGYQAINHYLKTQEGTKAMMHGQGAGFFDLKDKFLTWLESNGNDAIRPAIENVRAAHVHENFNSWLPKNKFGDPDALRTILASFAGLKGIATGNILEAATPLTVMPKVGGRVLQAAVYGNRAANALAPQLAITPRAAAGAIGASVPLASMAGGEPQSNQKQAMAWLKMGNQINPSKSGDYVKALRGINHPGISGSGPRSLQDFADKFTGGDQQQAIKLLTGGK